MDQKRVVDGFLFESEDVFVKAKKEQEGVRYMKARVDLSRPEQVLQIYQKMVDGQMFQTAVGQAYLRELREYLQTMPQVDKEQIPPIPIDDHICVQDASGTVAQLQEEHAKSRRFLHWSLVINVAAAAVIVVMFAIAASSSSPTILNYESRLVDKYSGWEQELSEREQAVREKERALNGEND